VPFEALQDPYGKAFWPTFKGRDGCRTPMPWNDDAPHAGFSRGEPWLPVPEEHRARNVDAQDADPASVLNAARAFLHWRKTQPTLMLGTIRFLDAPPSILAFVREHDGVRMLVAFNLSASDIAWTPPKAITLLDAPGVAVAELRDDSLQFPPRGAAFATLD
jgi:alpha-glucosidase